MTERVLVTGAAGYIGSHACLALLESGYDIVALDNFSNSKPEALRRVSELAGRSFDVIEVDLLDAKSINDSLRTYRPDAVIHFAGLKAVGESNREPLRYWRNNVGGSAVLLEAMQAAGVRKLVFSSSATVYGVPEKLPISEDAPLTCSSPYGQTKLAIERMLRDLQASDPRWNVSLLRYFNPVGAHPSGRIGEDPLGVPNNLMPFISQVAVGKLDNLSVFGNDYDTRDGTCIRDYIHIIDLVEGHLRALEWLEGHPGINAHNLGTGRGHTVLEMIKAFEEATGRQIPFEIASRRAGDSDEIYADPARANHDLGWQATRDVHSMCADAWNWQQQNPRGY